MNEIELSGPSEVDFGIEEIEDEDSDVEEDEDEDDDAEEDYDEAWVAALEDEDDQDDSNGTIGDWAKLETMRSSHPVYFAKKLTEVASDGPINWMEQPSTGLAIQGLLRPTLIEEHSEIQKHISTNQSRSSETVQTDVELEDFKQAKPDAIAHSVAKIISHLKAGGEKTTQALKCLCWRCKSIQVEEVAIISVDSLRFDLRVCCGTQIQTLRFAFSVQATSEYSAERKLNDLLFPGSHQKPQKRKQAHQNEC
ncbi:hypothetical protein PTKIN_Ptkin05aG0105700 [Pterospermum kingtungense]